MLPFRDSGPHTAQPVFLLLHFFGGSHREWDGVVSLLHDRHRLIAADLAGFGDAAALEGFTVADMAASITTLLRFLAPSPVILVGHSMSGKAAMVVASQPPDNLAGLVLVAPSPLSGEPMSDTARADMRIANTTRERAEQFSRDGFAHPPASALFRIAVEDVLRSSDDAFHAWPDQGTREDWSDRVTSLGVKTILIVGEQDKAIETKLQERETLPLVTATGGRMHLLPRTAHLIPYEQPLQLADLLQQFVREL